MPDTSASVNTAGAATIAATEAGTEDLASFQVCASTPEKVRDVFGARGGIAALKLDGLTRTRKRADGVCHHCGGNFPPRDLTMDHLVPVISGGKSTKGNVVPACKACNTDRKHALPFETADDC